MDGKMDGLWDGRRNGKTGMGTDCIRIFRIVFGYLLSGLKRSMTDLGKYGQGRDRDELKNSPKYT